MNNIHEIIKYSQNLKILYVEDNDEIRSSTTLVLEEFFESVVVGVDGVDGFDKFNAGSFDLIITDINMPKLNGLEMIKKIRDIDSNLPILILSAYNELSYLEDSKKLGVEGYILKPLDMKQFLGVLEELLVS